MRNPLFSLPILLCGSMLAFTAHSGLQISYHHIPASTEPLVVSQTQDNKSIQLALPDTSSKTHNTEIKPGDNFRESRNDSVQVRQRLQALEQHKAWAEKRQVLQQDIKSMTPPERQAAIKEFKQQRQQAREEFRQQRQQKVTAFKEKRQENREKLQVRKQERREIHENR